MVHPDQTSSVPGRTIRDSLAHVLSVVQHSDVHNADAMILSVDHQAAFDMVEWDFIFQTFRAMNFGDSFIKCFEAIYCPGKVNSAVNVNGFISDFFTINRGIRQGCPASSLVYAITAEVVSHFIRTTRLIRGIPLCGTNNRITKYADDTSLFMSKFEEIDRIFEIFEEYKLASGSRLKPAKTQLLLLGNLRNTQVPERFQHYVVHRLKLYGMYFTAEGLDDNQNWEKCIDSINRLERRIPPFGVSPFGKIHFLQIYYLCMFNYLLNMITPSAQLIGKTYKAMVKYIWYPSEAHIISRYILQLPKEDGGIGFPNLAMRVQVNRLMLLIRVLSSKEELSWRRCFFHFYRRVENLTERQLHYVADVPVFYIEIRKAVIKTRFAKVGDFCWVFDKQVAIDKVTPKFIYTELVKSKNKRYVQDNNIFWAQHLGVDERFIQRSWKWSKANYVDGKARTVHYKLRHKSLFTNHRVYHFNNNGEDLCTLCLRDYGNVVREDNFHLMLLCPRAGDLYYPLVANILQRIAGIRNIQNTDIILGREIHDKSKQTCFNFIVQHAQLAIWTSRTNLENNKPLQNAEEIFRKNVFRNLCRVKVVTDARQFFKIFNPITEPNNSVIGFRLVL